MIPIKLLKTSNKLPSGLLKHEISKKTYVKPKNLRDQVRDKLNLDKIEVPK